MIARRILSFASGVALAVGILLLIAALAKTAKAGGEDSSGDFFAYTQSNGVVSFTDDQKRIPSSARNVTSHTWEELAARQQSRETPMAIPSSEYRVFYPATKITEEINPNRLTDCTGPLTVESFRSQQGATNRRMYSVVDSCGRVISTTPNQPVVLTTGN